MCMVNEIRMYFSFVMTKTFVTLRGTKRTKKFSSLAMDVDSTNEALL
jgi:hypothetical protein